MWSGAGGGVLAARAGGASWPRASGGAAVSKGSGAVPPYGREAETVCHGVPVRNGGCNRMYMERRRAPYKRAASRAEGAVQVLQGAHAGDDLQWGV